MATTKGALTAGHDDGAATTGGESQCADGGGCNGGEFKIPCSGLLRVVQGVAVATKTPDDGVAPVVRCISSRGPTACLSLADWHAAIVSDFFEEEALQQLASLALGVAFLREKGRAGATVTPAELGVVWGLIHGALTSSRVTRELCATSTSSQGFLAVPLCSLVENGNIDELFRFHVWLPDGQRGHPNFTIHSHQPFAQSWILAGEGKDHSFKAEPVADDSTATHAEYAVTWSDGKELGTAYKTHQKYSKIVNTQKFVRATPTGSVVHSRDMTYTIPSAAFHTTVVQPDAFHATLFFFDSRRGFMKDAHVLGPKDGGSSTQARDPAGMTSKELASMTDAIRSWEIFIEQGRQHSKRVEWEEALRAFNSALGLCGSIKNFPNVTHYRSLALSEIGNTYRRFGRYETAKDYLERALKDMEPCPQRVEISGELGVVYRHVNELSDAQRVLQIQYDTAKELKFERAMCRAIGNLGMVNYQLWQQNKDDNFLELAIQQQLERIRSARRIKETIDAQKTDPNTKAHWIIDATRWESIGQSRLSLCYTACGRTKEAIAAALEAWNLARGEEDSTVVAFTSFLYGRALLRDGQRQEALKYFDPANAACTPAIVFCKEPSGEHLEYLRELVDAGADMDIVDEHGYTALDYAVFNGDENTEMLVREGLRRKFDNELERKVTEAKLRKGYRELFQEKLRPELLRISGAGGSSLHHLRCVYADALAKDKKKSNMFDGLKFVRYSDFLRLGKLPRSSDEGLVRQFAPEPREKYQGDASDFIIFFSYRWINQEPGATSPDDTNNTQYKRMIMAAEEFLRHHPEVDRERLGIWLDFACVNQANVTPGVVALPMNLTQCNAMISLVDHAYYDRAWCSVEVLMAKTLQRSFNLHIWYEHVYIPSSEDADHGGGRWVLREGPMDLEIVMTQKQLSFEGDRPKVMFLERQTKLLG